MEIDQPKIEVKHQANSDYYWNSYAHFGIHEEMLKDGVRTKGYRNAIMNNKHLFKDKIVLDVGCGTGILSLFAARAGAKKVFGIDYSDIVFAAQQIVKENNMDNVVTIIKGKVEEVELPLGPNEKVDIIVSEWMGYCLLYESMLPTVLFARDKWLRSDGNGIILPDIATMSICAIEDADYKEDKINFWDNVYGFKMSCIKKMAIQEPLVDVVESKQVMTTTARLISFDLTKVTKDELAFKVPFKITAIRDDYCHAFVVFFDVEFSRTLKKQGFSTGPHSEYTHWKQTVFYLNDVLSVKKGEEIKGEFALAANATNPRDLDLSIAHSFKGELQASDATQQYFLR